MRNLKSAFLIVGLLWMVYFACYISPVDLRQFGIHPRQIDSLSGIIFMPFLHANVTHLVSNSVALFILLVLIMSYERATAFGTMSIIVVVGGAGTWMFGFPGTNHIGASGLIFGLIGYLLFISVYRRDAKAFVYSLIVLFLFGTTLISLAVVLPDISWAAHFFGFLGGIAAAKFADKPVRQYQP